MQRHIERVMHRLHHMVGVGRTTAPVDDTGAAQTVQIQGMSGTPDDQVKVAALFGLSTSMPVGSDVTFVAVAGDSSSRIAVTTGHQESRPRKTPSGGTVLYDQGGTSIVLSNDNVLTITTSGGKVTITSPDTYTSGNLHAGTGATGSITDARGKVATFRDGVCVNII